MTENPKGLQSGDFAYINQMLTEALRWSLNQIINETSPVPHRIGSQRIQYAYTTSPHFDPYLSTFPQSGVCLNLEISD